MAAARVALVTKQSARLLARQLEHLRPLGDRFGKLELAGVNALELLVPPLARRLAPPGRGAKGAQVNIVDASVCQGIAQWRLGKARPPRIGDCPNIDHAPDPSGR